MPPEWSDVGVALDAAGRSKGRTLRIMLLTDVFPPGSGGSGWSTYYLGKALEARGHHVSIVRPRFGQGVARITKRTTHYGGLTVDEMLIPPPPAWATRLGAGKALEERAARRAMMQRAIAAAREEGVTVLHGQHALSSCAAADAARRVRTAGGKVAAVATIRDYWPLCPSSTRLFPDGTGGTFECTECHRLAVYASCVARGAGRPLPRRAMALLMALARWLRTWSAGRTLARCDAIIAVSHFVCHELQRSGRMPVEKLATVPNLVDFESVDRAVLGPWPLDNFSATEPFLLYAGKWDANKGAHLLPAALAEARVGLPLLLAGDGPLRAQIQDEATAAGLDFRFLSWLDNDAVLNLMHRARVLVFPSAWQEPLSRVLLEASAAGAAIVALDTGGTSDIIEHAESGWLARDLGEFAAGIRRVVEDDQLNNLLRVGARHRAEMKFAAPGVSERVEGVYLRALGGERKG